VTSDGHEGRKGDDQRASDWGSKLAYDHRRIPG
jgi:hypothetical protein